MLSEMQKDVLTELVNVFVGQAANILSEMVNQRIILTIPEVKLLSISNVNLKECLFDCFSNQGHIITSSLKFGNDFSGKAFLLFPEGQAKILVNSCMGEMMNESITDAVSLMDTDFDVLKEISNIILNAIIGEFGNLLQIRLEYALPDVELMYVSDTEQSRFLINEIYVLVLHTSFLLEEANVKGVLIIALSMNSISLLLRKIDDLLRDVNG